MTPLDMTGMSVTQVDHLSTASGDSDWSEDTAGLLLSAETLGVALRQARLALGRSLEDLSGDTRVRPEYLLALEEDRHQDLPAGPFSLGYVRAYARALGLDQETAADRFKAEGPNSTRHEPLKPPVGSDLYDAKPRRPWIVVAVAVLIAGFTIYNVVQYALLAAKPETTSIVRVPTTWSQGAALVDGALLLGQARQAPRDQNRPVPYITPGLEDQLAAAITPVKLDAGADDASPVRRAFNPRGAIYGADPSLSGVTLMATKSVNIVVRSNDGGVYFVRQLNEGEAYRAPLSQGLPRPVVIDVSDPSAFEVYYNGEYGGHLETPITPLASLNAVAMRRASNDEDAQARRAVAASGVTAPRLKPKTAPTAPLPEVPVVTPGTTPDPTQGG